MSGPIRIGLAGATGRMGQAIIQAIGEAEGMTLGPCMGRPECAGQTAGGVTLVGPDALLAGGEVIIDVSTPAAAVVLAQAAAARGGPALVIGATGFSQDELEALEACAARVPLLRSGNFSLGVNLLLGLVEQAARALEAADWDIEIFEAHHRRKVDAPSGTALMLGEAAARGRGVELKAVEDRGRDGLTGPRQTGAIGFSVLRGGGIVGEHSVTFAGAAETLILAHSARDRSLFAQGAVTAARWAAGQPPGLYEMVDVLGLRAG